MSKYVCPKCGMSFDKPGKCTMCHVELVEQSAHHAPKAHDHTQHHKMMMADFVRRLYVALPLSIPVLLLSPLIQDLLGFSFSFQYDSYVVLALATVVFLYGGWPFLKGFKEEALARQPGMMTLIALAISVAYVYSAATVLGLPGEPFFWELVTLIDVMLIGHWIEMRSVIAASGALRKLAELMPSVAHLENGKDVPLSELKKGDTVVVRPGEKVPADGIVVSGKSYLDEAFISGESKPVKKEKGSKVVGGSINGDSSLTIKVEKTGEESYLSKVITLVSEAQSAKSKTQKLADKAALILTFVGISAGSAAFIIWMIVTNDAPFAVARLATVLVITCPHALGVAIPLVAASSTAQSAQGGILIRNRTAFEGARNISAVIFDKTGTLTEGKFAVSGVQGNVLALAASVEQHSEHPIARAIVAQARGKKLRLHEPKDFTAIKGEGVSATIAGKKALVVSPAYILRHKLGEVADEQATIVYVVQSGKLLGSISLADRIRDESKEAVSQLKKAGIKVYMLTGDNERVAASVAKELALDGHFSQVLPHQKQEKVRELQKQHVVAMVGDGVNDAPALAQADVGIAIGSGTDIAAETADLVLVNSDPRDVVKAISFGRKTYSKMVQNLLYATGYNVIAIPLAAGVLYGQGIILSPAIGAALMSASTVVVAINAKLLKLK